MDIKNEFKNGVKLAADAATDIAQSLMEKSRMRANANRIKQVIKGDTELRNQAYIELGRYFYENLREQAGDEQEALCVVIDKTSARISKASKKYLELINGASELNLSSENTEKIKQIVTDKAKQVKESADATVDELKEKAKATTEKAKIKVEDLSDMAVIKAQDLSFKAKETTADLTDKAKEKVDDFKAFIAPDEDIEALIDEDCVFDEIEDEKEKVEVVQEEEIVEPEQQEVLIDNNAEEDIELELETPPTSYYSDDEESPEEFEF